MRWLVASRLIWIFSVCLVRIQNNNRYSVKYDILLPSGMIPDFVCHTMYKAAGEFSKEHAHFCEVILVLEHSHLEYMQGRRKKIRLI